MNRQDAKNAKNSPRESFLGVTLATLASWRLGLGFLYGR